MTNEILQWLTRNSSLISALSSLFMVLIWVFYAHLLYRDFRTRNHPRVIIQQAPDRFIDSVCLIVNMSRQIVNIAGIISVGKGMDGTRIKEVTDYRQYSSDEFSEKEIQTLLKQGPLASGDFISLGSFQKIINNLDREEGDSDREKKEAERIPPIDTVEIRLIIFSDTQDLPIGAYREFRIEKDDQGLVNIIPETVHTHQMTSFWQRRRVKTWMKEL